LSPQASWTTAGKKQREKLLELIRRLAEDDKDGVMAFKVYDLIKRTKKSLCVLFFRGQFNYFDRVTTVLESITNILD